MVRLTLIASLLLCAGCLRFADEVKEVEPGQGDAGVDPGAGEFTSLEVVGSCAQPNNRLYIWAAPMSGERMLMPTDRLDGKTLASLFENDQVTFARNRAATSGGINGDAIDSLGGAEELVQLVAEDVDFELNEARDGQDRLVVMVLDNSARMQAADPNGHRISFLTKLNRLIPVGIELAVVVVDEDGPRVAVASSQDRSEFGTLLFGLADDASGDPALLDGLDFAFEQVVGRNESRASIVFALTSGLEGDRSQAGAEAVVRKYKQSMARVPVVVAHLLLDAEAKHDTALSRVACDTDGSVVTVRSADEFDRATRSDVKRDYLTPAIAARMQGGWRIEASYVEALAPGEWLIDTRLNVQLGSSEATKVTRTRVLEQDEAIGDARIFLDTQEP